MIRDHNTFLILCRARSGALYLAERDLADCDRQSTIQQIASGEFPDLVQVLEFNPVEGWSRDVTEDVAMEVSTRWADQGESLARWQRAFVEGFCGMRVAAAFPREREMV